jgi:uncharacterized protein (TIGR03437 family)
MAAALAQSPQNIVVTSAAGFQLGIPARGSIGTIFCTGLRLSGTTQAQGTPLPWSLAGVSVTVGGAPAPLFSVSDLGGYQQINFQVPQEAVMDGAPAITVTQNGGTGTAMLQNYPLSSSPGEFFTLPNSPYGAFQHATDYSTVTLANPAHAGETIIGYLTGLRDTVPVVATGQASPFSPLAIVPQQPPSNTSPLVDEYYMGYPAAAIDFLGLAPGLIGVYQANFALPSRIVPGDIAVELVEHWCNDACFIGGQGWQTSRPVLIPVR